MNNIDLKIKQLAFEVCDVLVELAAVESLSEYEKVVDKLTNAIHVYRGGVLCSLMQRGINIF